MQGTRLSSSIKTTLIQWFFEADSFPTQMLDRELLTKPVARESPQHKPYGTAASESVLRRKLSSRWALSPS